MGNGLLFEIIISLGVAIVAVLEPIIIWFWRKIQVAAAKRRGMYECFIIYPEGGTERRFLMPKNNAVEWKRGKTEYLGPIPNTSGMFSIKEGMPQLILNVSDPTATNINEIINEVSEAEAEKLRALLLNEGKDIKASATVVRALEAKKKPVDPNMHTLKQQILAFEGLNGGNKKDMVVLLLVIVLLIAIASVGMTAYVLSIVSGLAPASGHAAATGIATATT